MARGEPPRTPSLKILNAKHVSNTNSGHVITMEQPQLVLDANPGKSSKQFVRREPCRWAGQRTDTELLRYRKLAYPA